MTQRDPAFDCLFDTISSFLLPFFLAGAAGNSDAARVAVAGLINAYNPRTTAELDLVGRVIGFSTVALDNLRLSMADGLSDTKVLRYRSSAVSSAEPPNRLGKSFQANQEQRESTREIPRPTVVAAPAPKVAAPAPKPAVPASPRQLLPVSAAQTAMPPLDIEAMKRDARMMIAAFSKQGASGAAIPIIPDPAAAVSSAVRAAVNAARPLPGLNQQTPAK